MSPKVPPRPPRGLMRWLARFPLWFYRAHLGWLLGHRFLRLTTVGRHSGRPRSVVLEVVRYEAKTGTCYVASGFGEKAAWLNNLTQNPAVSVQVGSRRFQGRAERLGCEAVAAELEDYVRRHPRAARMLARTFGLPFSPESLDVAELARRVPLVALRPE